MKTMTEKEIRIWAEHSADRDDTSFSDDFVEFARHVGALKEPVVKYQYVYKGKSEKNWNGVTGLRLENELFDDENIVYKRLDFTRTEE